MDNNENNLPQNGSNEKEELSSLISNAIENKKILEQADKSINPQKRLSNTQSINRTASMRPVAGRPTQQGGNSANGQKKPAQRPARPTNENDRNSTAPAGAKKNTGSKKRKWSKKKKTGVTLGIIFLAFVIILAVIVGLFFHYTGLLNRNKDTKINSGAAPLNSSEFVDESNTVDEVDLEAQLKAQLASQSTKISDENVMNILLIGEDIRDTEGDDRGNTDVMLLISINKEAETITMTSLMRDMYVYMSEYNNSGRINSAYWHGGCEYLESVVEDYFGVEIDRYVKVNFYQFIDVVEAIGGIDMEISGAEAEGMRAPLDEQNKYLGNKKGTDYIDLSQFPSDSEEKIMLHLNGNQALSYARLRYVGNSDWERTDRQRRVIKEVIKESKNLSFLKFDALVNKVFPNVSTDITDGEIASLLLDAFDIMSYSTQELRLPAEGYYSNEIISNMDVLVPDFTSNAVFLQKIVYGDCTDIEEAKKEYQDDLNNGVYFNADGTVYSENDAVNYDQNYNGYDNYGY